MYSESALINLIDKLRLENQTELGWLEFKSNYLPLEEFGKDISALSNYAASREIPFAYLVFGVHDKTHEVIGTDFKYHKAKKGNEDLEPWLNRVITPNINFKFYEFEYSALKNVVLIEIPAAYKEPTRFLGETYIRIGSYTKNIKGYPELERELWATFNDLKYEERPSRIQSLHFKYLESKLKEVGRILDKNAYKTLRLLDDNNLFNNLAYLVSDENPYIVKFAYYKNSKMDFRVKKEFEGSWLKILDDVLEYANLYNDKSARVLPGRPQRVEVLSYPEPSLREMIINAFMHLQIDAPSNIKIEYFPNRVDIGSPGPLYKTTLDQVLNGRQSFRNPNLINLFDKLGYIENYATGFTKTKEAYKPYEQIPEFISMENFFLVRLPNINHYLFDDNNQNKTFESESIELSEQEQIVVDYIRQYGSIRRIVVEDILEIKQTRAGEILRILVEKHIIVSSGNTRNQKYKLKI